MGTKFQLPSLSAPDCFSAIFRNFLTFFLLYMLTSTAFSEAPTSYKDITFPALNEIKTLEPERIVLPNGLILYLMEDHELPTIQIGAIIRAGSAYEPPEKLALAEMTAEIMRSGGTKKYSGDSIDEELDSIASTMEFTVERTSTSLDAFALKDYFDTVLDILSDMLKNPIFPEDKIALEKVQQHSIIDRRNDETLDIAQREFRKLIYGANSPYARNSEHKIISGITRDDLVAFHKQYFRPNKIFLGISGDFNRNELLPKIEKAFGDWSNEGEESATLPEVEKNFSPGLFAVQRTDLNQSTIFLGHLGGLCSNPDFFAIQVMNRILSEGFTSRLFNKVRSEQGLAYQVFGRYADRYDYPGIFYSGCVTKSETTARATQAIITEITRLQTEEATDLELKVAKEGYLNSFVFYFDSTEKIVNRLMLYEFYGYPRDFLQKTKENIEKVTAADVLRVAKQYIQPDKLKILIVGNEGTSKEQLSQLNMGEVQYIDVSIPADPEKEQSDSKK